MGREILAIRCSRLPLLHSCAGAWATEAEGRDFLGVQNAEHESATFGKVLHALVQRARMHETVTIEDVREAATSNMLDPDELISVWSRAGVWTDDPPDWSMVEEQLSMVLLEDGTREVLLTGRPDLVELRRAGKLLRIHDWKSGRTAGLEHSEDQLRGYAVLADQWIRETLSTQESIYEVELWLWPLRGGDPRVVKLWPFEVSLERQRLIDLAKRILYECEQPIQGRTFRTGEHCTTQWCDARVICPAFREKATTAIAVVTGGIEIDPDTVERNKDGSLSKRDLARKRNLALVQRVGELIAKEPDRVVELRETAGWVYDSVTEALRQHVEFWGPLPLQGGKQMVLEERESRGSVTMDVVEEALRYAEVPGDLRDVVKARIECRDRKPYTTLVQRKKK